VNVFRHRTSRSNNSPLHRANVFIVVFACDTKYVLALVVVPAVAAGGVAVLHDQVPLNDVGGD
jgi:hypothetical protein